MPKFETADLAEAHEVELKTLRDGDYFEIYLHLSGSVMPGRLVAKSSGSAETSLGWISLATRVVKISQDEYQKENDVAKKEKRAKGPKAVKEAVSYNFEKTAKESKGMLDAENKSQLAVIYRAVVSVGPADFGAIWKDVRDVMHKAPRGGETEKRQTNVRTYLSRLVKSGHVKRVKVKTEVKESASESAAA